jgi:predicted ATP-dependent serine protease
MAASRIKYWKASQVRKKEFETLELDGIWKDMIGKPSKTFWLMFVAPPKEGKSTSATDLANYLTKFGQVCYCVSEEGISLSLQQRLERLNIDNDNLKFVQNIGHEDLERIFKNRHNKFIVIDSPDHLDMPFEEAKALFEKWHKRKSCILVVHGSASGAAKRGTDWDHLVDVIIRIKDGYAHCNGRFGSAGKVKLPVFGKAVTPSLFD